MVSDQQDFNFALHSKTQEQQAGLRETLSQLNMSHESLGIQVTNRVAQLEEVIVKKLQENATPNSRLVSLLTDLESESFNLRKQIRIIKSLHFPQLSERADNIKAAHPATFEWLFENKGKTVALTQSGNIFDWLRKGTGTYWVSGKAGSGKSTLMKFFYSHRKTTAALKYWAAGSRLLVASFFFWNAGTKLQKGQQGLLQTLLLHVFTQEPSLISVLCPQRWQRREVSEGPWTWNELLDTLSNLKDYCNDDLKLCLFIDGLDEYEGEHIDVIKIIENLVCSSSIKICFSSRPWVVFERFFGNNSGQKLRLQELTRADIARFARDELALTSSWASRLTNVHLLIINRISLFSI